MNYTDKKNKIKFSFLPLELNDIQIEEAIKNRKEPHFLNDIYEKYYTHFDISGEMIVCKNYKKQDAFCKKVMPETYKQYLEFISKRDFSKDQWVYNILDGNAEQDRVLYKDDKIIILPNYTWDIKDIQKMHILTFPFDRTLKTIRDLNGSHITLLEHCRNTTMEIIKNTYGFDKDQIKIFIHYAPSTYHLHIHFTLVTNNDCCSSVEYSHELSNVIFNLSIKSDYYQTIIMNKRI
jgi:diadenosine tetraphosphate (Ap4A) HIT family hydrolase